MLSITKKEAEITIVIKLRFDGCIMGGWLQVGLGIEPGRSEIIMLRVKQSRATMCQSKEYKLWPSLTLKHVRPSPGRAVLSPAYIFEPHKI
jgi:hypothetical protein